MSIQEYILANKFPTRSMIVAGKNAMLSNIGHPQTSNEALTCMIYHEMTKHTNQGHVDFSAYKIKEPSGMASQQFVDGWNACIDDLINNRFPA